MEESNFMTLRKIVGEVKNPTSGGIWSKEKETRCNKGPGERGRFERRCHQACCCANCFLEFAGRAELQEAWGDHPLPPCPVGMAPSFLLPVHRACRAASLSSFLSQLPALCSFSFSHDGPAEKVQAFWWHLNALGGQVGSWGCQEDYGVIWCFRGTLRETVVSAAHGVGLHSDSSGALWSSEPLSSPVSTTMNLKKKKNQAGVDQWLSSTMNQEIKV